MHLTVCLHKGEHLSFRGHSHQTLIKINTIRDAAMLPITEPFIYSIQSLLSHIAIHAQTIALHYALNSTKNDCCCIPPADTGSLAHTLSPATTLLHSICAN